MLYIIKLGFEKVNAKFFANLDKNALMVGPKLAEGEFFLTLVGLFY